MQTRHGVLHLTEGSMWKQSVWHAFDSPEKTPG